MNRENFTEKVSVNINSSTLSSIDLLVDNGYYSNRSDFINQALRDGLQKHQNTLDRIIDAKLETGRDHPHPWFIGVYGLEQSEIQRAKEQGKVIHLTGYGVLVIGDDVDEEMLYEVVQNISIKGKVICRQRIKDHYGLK